MEEDKERRILIAISFLLLLLLLLVMFIPETTTINKIPEESLLIDIRPSHEYNEGHIERAINIYYCGGCFGISHLDKSKTIVIYGDNRMEDAYKKFKESGFDDVYILEDYRKYL